jgi:hypothetical protein
MRCEVYRRRRKEVRAMQGVEVRLDEGYMTDSFL